jgi:phage terminase large subunit-like protein
MVRRKKIEPPRDIAGYDPIATAGDCQFDADAAQLVLDFFPTFLTHVKGFAGGKPFDLNPWEKDYAATLIGWKRPDGTRRYRESLVGIPRKNNKTTFCAGLGLFLLLCDREQGPDVYIAAETANQAANLFEVASVMVARNPDLARLLKVNNSPADRRIIHEAMHGKMRVVTGDASTLHGLHVHAAIIDELHTQPNREVYDVLKTGTAQRRQPLVISITTAGTDRESVCYELWNHARNVRDGSIDDRYFLPCLYEMEETEDWQDKEVWARVNPNLGRSVTVEYLEESFSRAKNTPAFENTFRNLHLNQWTESESRWIGTDAWNACQGEYPDLEGKACFVGLDLASTDDMTAMVYVFPVGGKYYIVPHFWVPDGTMRDRPKIYHGQYRQWVSDGLLNVTPTNSTDYEYVRQRLLEDSRRYQVVQVAYDGYQAHDTYTILERKGFDCVKIAQTGGGMWPGIKATQEAILNGSLVHDDNNILRWMLSCVVTELDAQNNIKMAKKKSSGKIDGIVAMCMAMGRASSGESMPSVYNERGLLTI